MKDTKRFFEAVESILIDAKIKEENSNRNGINDAAIERIDAALLELKDIKNGVSKMA